ncbi:MAG TPA: efflux transporter periplasmic adaptor subunit [Cyanobacteria bacterium UBA8156]|nr:efflux transporter periplasmic adaptor subunit [Cyanobacteria bacterium UBA8156]
MWCQPGGGPPEVTPVQIEPARTGTLEDTSEYVANLNNRQSVTLRPRVAGQVATLQALQGDTVTAGTTLLQIDPSTQKAALESAQANAQAAQADVAAFQAAFGASDAALNTARANLLASRASRLSRASELELQRRNLDRDRTLAEQGVIPSRDLENRVNAFENATANLNTLDRQIEAQTAAIAQAEAEVNRAQANLAAAGQRQAQAQAAANREAAQLRFFTVVAPFDGTIGSIPVKVGDAVTTDTPLLTLTQNQTFELEIAVPLENAPRLRVGLPVRVLDREGKPQAEGTLAFVAPDVSARNQSILVKAGLENPNEVLRANQFLRAQIVWEQREGVLIPNTAIVPLAGQNFVFVATEKAPITQRQPGAAWAQAKTLIARQKPVKIGRLVGNDREILEGLQPGEKVVVGGLQTLRDGSKITPATTP